MIDWLNPSDDILDARSIGFAEGQQSRDEEVTALTAERDALAAELSRLRTLEAAAIAYRHAYIEVEENEPEALQALFRSARDAEKARNACPTWNAWQACCEANGVGEPSDVDGLRQACRDLLAIVADAIIHGMPITPAVADARNRAVAALAKREERG